jgi:hypothetical protein
MQTLWTFGCSFTEDMENAISLYCKQFPELYYCKYKKFKNNKVLHSWPTLLARKITFKLKNISRGGSSNDHILKSITENFDKFKEGDIVILQWTFMQRFMICKNDELVSTSNIDHDDINQFYIEYSNNKLETPWYEYYRNILKFITHYLIEKNINILHWSLDDKLFDNIEYEYQKYILHNVLDSIIKTDETIWLETRGKIKDGHLSEKGHKKLSNYFYQKINEIYRF